MTAPSHGPRRMNKERCRRSFVCTGWSFHGGRNEYRYGKVNDNTRTAQLPPSLCNPPPGWEGRSEGRPQSAAHEGVVQHKRATPSLMQRERREQTPSESAPSLATKWLCPQTKPMCTSEVPMRTMESNLCIRTASPATIQKLHWEPCHCSSFACNRKNAHDSRRPPCRQSLRNTSRTNSSSHLCTTPAHASAPEENNKMYLRRTNLHIPSAAAA